MSSIWLSVTSALNNNLVVFAAALLIAWIVFGLHKAVNTVARVWSTIEHPACGELYTTLIISYADAKRISSV